MKTNPSHYVLAAELLIIILFHAVKIKRDERHPADSAFVPLIKNSARYKPAIENKTSIEFMLVNLIK
jgi:hypothetical protein